ncbi:MAG: 4Fe-4S binding protein [Thermoplasmata archaeon]
MSMIIQIDPDLCTGCGICIRFCPKNVLESSERLNKYDNYLTVVARPEDCIGCKLCELYCPDFAICVEEEK